MTTNKEKAKWGAQVSLNTASGTSSYQSFSGTLSDNPAIIIFDNQSNVAVTISDDGTTDGKTFSAGEALVLDLRTNASLSKELSWPVGTQFSGKSAAGTGSFVISYVYAS